MCPLPSVSDVYQDSCQMNNHYLIAHGFHPCHPPINSHLASVAPVSASERNRQEDRSSSINCTCQLHGLWCRHSVGSIWDIAIHLWHHMQSYCPMEKQNIGLSLNSWIDQHFPFSGALNSCKHHICLTL